MTRILVVDDEPAIADAVSYSLRSNGWDVDVEPDGTGALNAAAAHDYDLVLLDLRLPDLSGVEVCRRLRATSDVPVLMLTALDAEVDRVVGLDAGADDYVTKPFSMAELISRVRAILRRRDLDRTSSRVGVRYVGALRVDLVRHEAAVSDRRLDLTPSEFRLLALLVADPERAFSRREIMQHLWNSSFVGSERACDVHVANLRQKLEDDPARPQRLVTVRGVGYKLVAV